MMEKLNLDFPTVAYVIGIVSIVQSFISPIAGIAFGIIGISFSKKKKNPISKVAFKLNLIGLIIGCIIFVAAIVANLFLIKNSGLSLM